MIFSFTHSARAARQAFVLLASLTISPFCFADEAPPERSYEAVFADLALACIHKEYSNKVALFMNSEADLKPPRVLYPSFFGCFDWHSSVHGHWLLVRLLNTSPTKIDAELIVSKLDKSFRAENIAGELATYQRPGMASFERPYGIAWLLQLTAGLRESSFPEASRWLQNLLPLEQQAVRNMSEWLPKLTFPIRTGEHSQTAFAFALMLDWSRIAGTKDFEQLLTRRVRELYLDDKACPLTYEPSGQDFLSPCLAEADLMRRVMDETTFAKWLTEFFPLLAPTSGEQWLTPGVVTDKSDGKLAHLDGLNTSRAWMLEGIISGLPEGDRRIAALRSVAEVHRTTGLNAVLGDIHYMGSHWLGSFATYLETKRGLSAKD
ncbi:MAG: DUF2891 domain-containing protein [Pseudomonadota bacterium]